MLGANRRPKRPEFLPLLALCPDWRFVAVLLTLNLANRSSSDLQATLLIGAKHLRELLLEMEQHSIVRSDKSSVESGSREHHITNDGRALIPVLLGLAAWAA